MRCPKATLVRAGLVLFAVVAGAGADQRGAPPVAAGGASQRLLVPHESWPCGLAGGIPTPETGNLLFTAVMPLERVADIGATQYGRRRVAVTQQGTITGAQLSGTVMMGGLDLELTLANGVIEVEQHLVLRTSGGKYVYARTAGTGSEASDVRIVMDFEAPAGSDVAWLNAGTYVARRVLDVSSNAMTLRVYGVPAPTASAENAIRITKPAGVPPQPWEYRRADPGEKQGAQLMTERVTLSPSQSVGTSKRGNRNIIPITGGELSGRISGRVLAGGADYQNLSAPATIDARYLWQTADGEIIIVRNGGTFGSLVPTFEARVDSRYAWLNNGLYLSSNPGASPGGVALTFYESAR